MYSCNPFPPGVVYTPPAKTKICPGPIVAYPAVPSLRYGFTDTFPDHYSRDARVQHFFDLLFAFLRTLGIEKIQHTLLRLNTGGHSGIDYYALVVTSEDGGCECSFHTIGWTGEYEVMTPWVQLYGSWEVYFEPLSCFLSEQFPS